MEEVTHDLNHDLTFNCRHNQLCVPQYKLMFRVLGIYNFYLSGHENYDQESFLSTGWLLMKHLFSNFESGNNKNDNDGEDSDIDEHETTKDPLDEG